MARKLVFLGTGGTIAGTAEDASDNVGYQAAQVGVAQLLGAIRGLKAQLADWTATSEQVCQIDSKDMGWTEWQAIALRANHWLAQTDVGGLVLTHGTDTLEETAFFLSQVLPAELLRTKPVVLTCAMRPASALSPDGPQNMLDAVATAQAEGAHGVLVVCAGQVHGAAEVAKMHTYDTRAFDSGDAGPVALVEEGQLRLLQPWPELPSRGHAMAINLLQSTQPQDWPRVEIIQNHVAANGAIVRALCASPIGDDAPLTGIVVAGTGNGTLQHDLERALRQAQRDGVRVVRASRCARGRVIPTAEPGALPHSQGLSAVKARIAMVLQLLGEKKAA